MRTLAAATTMHCTGLTELLTSRTKVYRNFPKNLISMFTKRNWLGESFFISLSVQVQMLLTDLTPFFSFLLFFSRVSWVIIKSRLVFLLMDEDKK